MTDPDGWTVTTLKHLVESMAAALLAAKEAVEKAERAAEKRFESVNEFRSQLADQAASFMPRSEAEALIRGSTEKIDALTARIDKHEGGAAGISSAGTIAAAVVTALIALAGLATAIIIATR